MVDQGWGPSQGEYPAPPANPQVVSPLFVGALDIRWDDPRINPCNAGFDVVGVNIYRSDTSDRGPYRRINRFPIGGTFYRDQTDNILIENEIVEWSTSWLNRGKVANGDLWKFQTRRCPIVKRSGQAIAADSPADVQVSIDGRIVPVHAVFGPTGEITLINVPTYDFARQQSNPPILPNENSCVTVTYHANRNLVESDLDKKLWYRLTTVATCLDDDGNPVTPSGFIETPLNMSPAKTSHQIETMDWMWREAVRRNNWILEQGGERVKVMIRKCSGLRCFCGRDPRTVEVDEQPKNRCQLCLPPGTEVTMKDFTRKLIEEVQVGDEVLTHTGQVRKVYETMSREVEENLVEIRATHGVGITPTGNHPVLVVRREDARCVRNKNSICTGPCTKKICTSSSWKNPCEYSPQSKPQWVRADEVREGDYLVFTLPQEPAGIDALHPDQLRVLGYYAAEGWTSKKQKRDGSYYDEDSILSFGFHTKEIPTFVSELQGLLSSWYGAKSSVQPCSNSEKGCALVATKKDAAQDALQHVGKYSQKKRLSTDLVWQDLEKSKLFLGSYFNGDGWQCLNDSRTHLGVSTASYNMARQVEVMLLRQGVVPRFDVRTRTDIPNPNREGTHTSTEHTVAIRKTDMAVLADSMQMSNVKPKMRKAGWAVSVGKLVLYPVRSVRHVPYKGLVYNFEVEEDHSYVANGAVVHNCYGVGFVGGYEGAYDLIIAPDDSERRVAQTPNGRRLEHQWEIWTGPSPLLTQRDFIIRQTNERYSIGAVRKPSARGNIMQQHFSIGYLDEQDIRYSVPIPDPSSLQWPQIRDLPPSLQGGAWRALSPHGPYPEGPTETIPHTTDKENIPDEREKRGRTSVWENTEY